MAGETPGGHPGNQRGPGDDWAVMGCDRCREEISANLDGEADPDAANQIAEHLVGCDDCAAWASAAARVTRLARTAVADPGPDLVDAVLVHAPRPRRWAWSAATRAGLALVGAAQLALGVVSLLAPAAHLDDGVAGSEMLGAGMVHMSHETAAWNLAPGVAFLAGSVWHRHLSGLLPALGVFIAVLTVLSALDLLAGRVQPDRVASHALLVVGFALALVVARTGPRRDRGPSARSGRPSLAPPVQTMDSDNRSRPGLGPVARRRHPDAA